MRWSVFIPVALLAVVLQSSIGLVLRVPLGGSGSLLLWIDLLALLALTAGLRSRKGSDVVLAGWMLGLLVDLSNPGERLGLFALTFALAGGAVFRLREAVFLDNPVTQVLLGLLLTLMAHGGAVMLLALLGEREYLGRDLLQAILVSLCTAAIAPVALALLGKLDRWLWTAASRRS